MRISFKRKSGKYYKKSRKGRKKSLRNKRSYKSRKGRKKSLRNKRSYKSRKGRKKSLRNKQAGSMRRGVQRLSGNRDQVLNPQEANAYLKGIKLVHTPNPGPHNHTKDNCGTDWSKYLATNSLKLSDTNDANNQMLKVFGLIIEEARWRGEEAKAFREKCQQACYNWLHDSSDQRLMDKKASLEGWLENKVEQLDITKFPMKILYDDVWYNQGITIKISTNNVFYPGNIAGLHMLYRTLKCINSDPSVFLKCHDPGIGLNVAICDTAAKNAIQ